MKTKRRLTDEEALAIAEDESTVWGPRFDNTDQLEIRALIRVRQLLDGMIDDAVIRGRHNGLVWLAIGDALGVSAEAARKMYNSRV